MGQMSRARIVKVRTIDVDLKLRQSCGVGELGRVCLAMWNDAMLAGGGFICTGVFDPGAWNPATKNAFLSFGAVISPPPPIDDHEDETHVSPRSYEERCFVDLACMKSQEFFPRGTTVGHIHITNENGTIGTKDKEVAHKELNRFQRAFMQQLDAILDKRRGDISVASRAQHEAMLGVLLVTCCRDYAIRFAQLDRARPVCGTRAAVPLFRTQDVNTCFVASPGRPDAKVRTHLLLHTLFDLRTAPDVLPSAFVDMLASGSAYTMNIRHAHTN